MNDVLSKQCRQPGCGGPTFGQCLEHFPFDECPNLISLEDLARTPIESDAPSADRAGGDSATELVTVSVGPAFGTRDADAFLRRNNAVVVSLLAGPEVGKTTLIATMYELARRRAFVELRFAGTESIRGFEERCHLSRHSSGGAHPDTQRTRSGPPQFLHLRLADATRSFDLLLSDRAGEFVTKVLEQPDSIAALPEVARADHLLLLVDGSELFHRAPQASSTAKRIFQALKQNDLLGSRCLHLVITKRDLFTGLALEALEQRARRLADFMAESHPFTRLHLTEARQRQGGGNFGEGIEALLQALKPRVIDALFVPVKPTRSTHSDDALSRFMDAMEGDE